MKDLGAGAWNQLASDLWRGGVSSIVGASWFGEYRFALAPVESNRFLDPLFFEGCGQQIGCFGALRRVWRPDRFGIDYSELMSGDGRNSSEWSSKLLHLVASMTIHIQYIFTFRKIP